MQIEDLKIILDNELGKIYKTIMITGDWGIGKSYFISKYLKKYKTSKISLFSISNKEELRMRIRHSFDKIKLKKYDIEFSKDNISFEIPFINITPPNISKKMNKYIESKMKKNNQYFLVFDDIERKNDSITLKEIFGVISELGEINNLNIIIIMNKDYILELNEEDKKTYKDFHEKVIEKQYQISKRSEEALDNICNELYYSEGKDYLKECFQNSNNKNLRTLIKTVKFLNSITKSIDISKIDNKHMNKIIECVLNYMITINNKDFNSDKDITEQIIFNNWKTNEERKQEKNIIGILNEIYLTLDYSLIDEIMQLFVIKDIVEPEKDLFYCSKEELIERAKAFKQDVLLNYNPIYNVSSLLQDIFQINEYLKLYKCEEAYSKEDIDKAINLYVENEKINYNDIFEVINRLNKSKVYTSTENNEFAKSLLIKKYINYYIEKNKKEKYNTNNAENLFGVLGNNLLIKDFSLFKEELSKIKKDKYYLPNLNDAIDEKIWSFTHMIFDKIHFTKTGSILRIEFEETINKEYKKCSEVGKYRYKSLAEQYGFMIEI